MALAAVAGGAGAVALGLGTAPSKRTSATAAMTVAWYTPGGLVAGAVYSRMAHTE
jgi:hypothetical protein